MKPFVANRGPSCCCAVRFLWQEDGGQECRGEAAGAQGAAPERSQQEGAEGDEGPGQGAVERFGEAGSLHASVFIEACS